MRFGYLAAGIAAVLAFGVAGSASASALFSDTGFGPGAVQVDFDAPTLAAGTVVSNEFAAQGVTFSSFGGGDWGASGNPGPYSGNPGFSGSYLDSFSSFGGHGFGTTWSINFASLANRAGAYFEFNTSAPAVTLTAYNGATAVDSFSYDNPGCCSSTQFLGFSDVSFNRIVLSNITGDDFIMDGLHYESAGVPEPATWALMIGGFGLTGAALRRRRTVAATA